MELSQEMIDGAVAAANARDAAGGAETVAPAQVQATARPDWVEDKFWDAEKGQVRVEDLAKSYRELEAQRSRQAHQKPAEAAEPAGLEVPAADAAAEELATSAGFDRDALATEFTETNGAMKPATLDKLAEALKDKGIAREDIEEFFEGKRLRAQAMAAEAAAAYDNPVKAEVGGDEGYKAMVKWASTTLSASEIAEFNEAVTSGKLGVAKFAVKELHSRYKAEAVVNEPSLVDGGRAAATTSDAYSSMAEITSAMANPLYNSYGPAGDAYRAQVDAKIARSAS